MTSIQIFESDFGAGTSRGSAKTRRLSKRKLKKLLLASVRDAWSASAAPSTRPVKRGLFVTR